MPYIRNEEISPEMAKMYLARSRGNRRISELAVRRLAAAMKAGEWTDSSDCIAFDTNGVLINGHHRLNAVIAANCCVVMQVMYGLPPEAVSTIDTGKVRSASDIVEFRRGGIDNTRRRAAAARLFLSFRRYEGFDVSAAKNATKKQLADCVLANLADTPLHYDIEGGRFSSQILAFETIAKAFYDHEMVDEFLQKLADLVGLEDGSPILALRGAFVGAFGNKRLSGVDMSIRATSYIIKAFSMYKEGEKCKRIRLAEIETFPKF